jgi:glycosyltransferase involved in cell wall biosynthesis
MRQVKAKPRVAFLLQMFGVGGMPKWLFNLASVLRDEFDFYFIATHSDYVLKEYSEVAQVDVLPFKKAAIAWHLFRNRIDIAQVANLRLYTEAALLARVPVVIERTDGLRRGKALGSKEGLDAVIASAEGVVPHLEKLIQPEKIHLIRNGIDLSAMVDGKGERFGFGAEDVIVGRTSRLAGGKNISLLIRAVIELRKEPGYQHVRLVVCGGDTTQVGAPPMLEKLKAEAADLNDSVIFTGEVADPSEVTWGYDIATCTSRPDNEGIPNSLIEAMAAGRAVVASDVGNISELVSDKKSGLLFESDDLASLIEALKVLIDDGQLRSKMGLAGRKIVEEDYDLTHQAQKYESLYRRLLRVKGRHMLNRWPPLGQAVGGRKRKV